jgi:hypothetical protein
MKMRAWTLRRLSIPTFVLTLGLAVAKPASGADPIPGFEVKFNVIPARVFKDGVPRPLEVKTDSKKLDFAASKRMKVWFVKPGLDGWIVRGRQKDSSFESTFKVRMPLTDASKAGASVSTLPTPPPTPPCTRPANGERKKPEVEVDWGQTSIKLSRSIEMELNTSVQEPGVLGTLADAACRVFGEDAAKELEKGKLCGAVDVERWSVQWQSDIKPLTLERWSYAPKGTTAVYAEVSFKADAMAVADSRRKGLESALRDAGWLDEEPRTRTEQILEACQ